VWQTQTANMVDQVQPSIEASQQCTGTLQSPPRLQLVQHRSAVYWFGAANSVDLCCAEFILILIVYASLYLSRR